MCLPPSSPGVVPHLLVGRIPSPNIPLPVLCAFWGPRAFFLAHGTALGLEDLALNPAAAGVVVEGLHGVHCWEVSVTVEARHRLTEAAAAR